MPREAIYAMVGIVGLMVVFAVFMATRSLRKARGHLADTKAGLRSLGLEMVSSEGAKTRSQGVYRGVPAWLESDGSAIMATGMGAYAVGLAAHFVSPALSTDTRDHMNRKLERMARSGMQHAPMQLRFGVTLATPTGTLEIRKEAFSRSNGIGDGLFARGDLIAKLRQPEVVAALAACEFDVITVSGDQGCAIWTPANRDYQSHVARDGFVGITDKTLAALTKLADALA